MKWTKEQQNVIDFRNRDILVSAAAGSGKTAVLVARIIQRILDPQNPVDIDRLLVVTFTKAAAAEMRERIGAAIEAECEKDPQNTHLRRQSALIHNAMITTIDSFCLFVVRNHFEEISLDPNFRIADEGEIRLLEQDVLEQVFEDNYARQEKTFLSLIDAYAGKRNDHGVGITNGDKIILSKYEGRRFKRYALIAGFAEIGETIEETVHREVMEEVGLKVKNLRYYKSQPWSFSGTLLFGFFCDVDGDDTLTVDHEELSMAQWVERDKVPDQGNNISLTKEMMMLFRDGKEPR